MKKKFIFFVGLLTIIIVTILALKHFIWDKPDTIDLSVKTPEYKLDAKTVIDFVTNDTKNHIKPNQIIEVEGVVKKISYLNNRVTIMLGTQDKENTFVICDMETNQTEKVKKITTNDTIKLKGVFKGILEDAIFLNCIISE